jgi:IS5 family transposase
MPMTFKVDAVFGTRVCGNHLGQRSSVAAHKGRTYDRKRSDQTTAEPSCKSGAVHIWHVAMKPGKRRALGTSAYDRILERIETLKAQVRARGEHAFRVVKRQFGYVKVRYRGLAKNTAQLHMLFALANIWMARRKLLATG